MAAANVIGKPEQQAMGNGGGNRLAELLDDKQGLLVKQTMRGCLQECMGCEAKSEFKIGPMEHSWIFDEYKASEMAMNQPEFLYALEESSCLCRLCWRDGRPFNMEVSEGSEKGGPMLLQFIKPCSFPLNMSIPTKDGSIDCPCCCFLPKLSTSSADGTPLENESAYICDINIAVPKLQYSEKGQPIYTLKPETCCGGCCIACNPCTGKGLLYIPFYFHDPKTGSVIGGSSGDKPYEGKEIPSIRKLWAGLKKECCSTADTFAVMFPQGIDARRKAGLLGLTFLLDFTVFERQQEKN